MVGRTFTEMDGSRIPKIASEYNLTGRREVGHPRKRWAP
jgi:hypothetical protein